MKVLLALLLLWPVARAQYERAKDDGLDVLTTPMHGEACGYESCLPIKPGYLNVHMVPQTHSELGHGYNFLQHFTGEDPPLPKNTVNMRRILDSIITQLWSDAKRRFTLSDTAYLFHWWKTRHPTLHRMVYELIRTGRLTIVGGGLGVSDESSTSYHSIIDHFTYSLRKLNATFRGCARPLVAWAADVFGHSREFTSLMAQMGYDALFINPISYDEEIARMRRKALEFLWRGSDDLGPISDMFTHSLFDGYWAPPGFCFSKLCTDPLLVTSNVLFSEVTDRVDKFIESVLYRQSPNFETQNIMVIMGHRKAYSDAEVWFANIEKLIAFTNWRAGQKQLNITLFYSNPPCYLAAVHDEKPVLETKQDDFFPYVHDKDSYTVGMYSSRPTFKYMIREANVYLQVSKQMQVIADLGPYTQFFDSFNWIMGVVQDHSVAPGVLRHRVKNYYTNKLHTAMNSATDMISRGFTKLRSSPRHVLYYRCEFNTSSCFGSRFIKYSVQVYNPLGWPVSTPVRLPIYPNNGEYNVYDNTGEVVRSATIRLPDSILLIDGRPTADHELVFIAADVPPVGFRSYYVEAQFYKKRIPINRKVGDYEELEDTTLQSIWKQDKGIPSLDKRAIDTLAAKVRHKKMIKACDTQNMTKRDSDHNSYVKSAYDDDLTDQVEVAEKNHMLTKVTTEADIMLPMLRNYLQKNKVMNKDDYVGSERELLSSKELQMILTTESQYIPDVDIPIDTDSHDIEIPLKKDSDDIRGDPDIRVMNRPVKLKSTTEPSDIEIAMPAKQDIMIPDEDIRVQVNKDRVNINNKPSRKDIEDIRTESLEIVPVRPSYSTPTFATRTDSTTESVLVVPVAKWEIITVVPAPDTTQNAEAISVTATPESITATPFDVTKHKLQRTDPNTEATLYIYTHMSPNENLESMNVVETSTAPMTTEAELNEDSTFLQYLKKSRAPEDFRKHAQKPLTIADVESSTISDGVSNSTDVLADFGADYEDTTPGTTPATTTTTTTESPEEKYFKVNDGSRLFIGNKYVRVNLDDNRRVTSIFLRNGVRINLEILMFHYVSDDPSKFDIRTVPRRDIKPPGAYVMRPIDPYIVRAEDNFDVKIIKTDIVEEIRMSFSNWTSLQMRLYVDSPVIELHWLVGPIPTDDGLGKEVFIRYKTNLQHEGAFYTDSNGRQTIKRIRGVRATYEPIDLDPITGNLYPVTSKIHIEDVKRNIRFAVLNDRCQAGGALIEGSIDLLLHRRILTDDIGFGAFLNETENDVPIRAAGTHYLYLSKADRNKIFEKKFAKEIALAPRVLISHHFLYTDEMRKRFYDDKINNEFTALNMKLPLGVHLLSLERTMPEELLIRLENYLEKDDVRSNGVRYVPLRNLFVNIKIIWLKETLLAANMFKDQWKPTEWGKRSKFYRRFNDFYGGSNDTYEEEADVASDDIGGKGIRLAPQQIRTFIARYKYVNIK